MSETGHCPRCHVVLEERIGVLHESVCGACQGRFLPPDGVEKLIVDELGHDPAFLRELAEHFAGERLSCPGCGAKMSPVTLRGAPIDLCQGCGGAWLDESELSRLSSGRYHEVGAEPPPETVVGEPVAAVDDTGPQIELGNFENPIYAKGAVVRVLPLYVIEGAGAGAFLATTVAPGSALTAYGAAMGASLLFWLGYGVAKVAIPEDLRVVPPETRSRKPRLGCMVQMALFVPLLVAAANHALREALPEKVRTGNFAIGTVAVTATFAALLTLWHYWPKLAHDTEPRPPAAHHAR